MFNFLFGGMDFAHKLDAASNPTEQYYKHVHTFNELLYFVEGNVEYTVESETRPLLPGDIVLIAPGKYHFAAVNAKRQYERYVLKFPDSAVPRFLSARIRCMGPFFAARQENAAVFEQFDLYHDFGEYSKEELAAIFTGDLVKLLIGLSKETAEAPRRTNTVIAAVIQYIDAHIRQPVSLDRLSEEFHFSKSYLSNEFKQSMKVSVMQYVRMKRVVEAHRRILAGEKKSYVAEQLGFENYSTFYRQYSKLLKEELPVPGED